MPQNVELKILTPMIDFSTGEPIPNISFTLSKELGLKTEIDIKNHRGEIPDLTFADVINALFDVIPTPSKNDFALYNNILIDIRNAKIKNSDTITIDKTELEKMKKLVEKGLPEKPEFNRRIGFINEVIDQAIANAIIANTA